MRALIIDDHPLIQDAVSNVLRRLDPSAEIAVAGDCERGLEIAGLGPEPDLVLLDLNLPGLSGIPALTTWRARFPGIPVIVLSAANDSHTVLAALGAGAAGYIVKASTNEVMLNAIRLVQAGGKYLPVEILSTSAAIENVRPRSRTSAPSVETLGLTARQMDVLRLIAKGESNKVICRELRLAERTVKAHVTAVFRALKVSSRTQAAIAASKLGLMDTVRTPDRSSDSEPSA
jgi:DNA-binding NarL/FixJ family response regulator